MSQHVVYAQDMFVSSHQSSYMKHCRWFERLTDRIVDSDIYCLEFLASTKIRTDRIVDSDTEQELTESLIRVNKDKADRTVDSELCTVGVLSLLCSTNQKKTQKLKVFSSPGDLKIY